jgi:acylphosphatase
LTREEQQIRRLHVVVRGRVQGVGFRYFAQEAARSLDVAGWVRNAADGSVEVEAEGGENALTQLRAALGDGPRGARVESIEDVDVGTEQLERPFRVKR